MRTLALPAVATLAGALVVLAEPAPAAADELIATRSQPLTEVSHTVEVTIDRGVARYRVRRAFANGGNRSDEARVHISLPHGAAATGLRIRARDRWYEGDLMEADEAREKYQELTGIGAWEPKDPALLQWTWADELMLQVFPVFAGSVNTVEYTLTAPLEYRDGTYLLSYPRANVDANGASTMADPVITVDPGYGRGTTPITVAGLRVAADTPAVLAVPPPPPWVGEGEPDPAYGYAMSPLVIEEEGLATKAEVTVDIDHTYSGDLHLSLVTPAGVHHELGGGDGAVAWDGVVGPHVAAGNTQELQLSYPVFSRADYTVGARQGLMSLATTAKVGLDEYKRRILAMARCYRALEARYGQRPRASVHIFSFREHDAADAELASVVTAMGWPPGPVYRFDTAYHADVTHAQLADGGRRALLTVRNTATVLVGPGRGVAVVDRVGTQVADWQPMTDA